MRIESGHDNDHSARLFTGTPGADEYSQSIHDFEVFFPHDVDGCHKFDPPVE
jgi:hypothetical protein